jgi:hypothetical protein
MDTQYRTVGPDPGLSRFQPGSGLDPNHAPKWISRDPCAAPEPALGAFSLFGLGFCFGGFELGLGLLLLNGHDARC